MYLFDYKAYIIISIVLVDNYEQTFAQNELFL